MSVIPNVYQAAYMQGLVDRNKKNNNPLNLSDIKKQINHAFKLGRATARPYTIDIDRGGDENKGFVIAVQNQTNVAEELTKRSLTTFPANSVVVGDKFRATRAPITQQSVSGFLKTINKEGNVIDIDTNKFKTKNGNIIKIGFRKISESSVEIRKSDIFGIFDK